MGKITFQAALGGSVDLVGPNTATAVTLNLPSASGSIVGTGSTGVVTSAMISGQIAVAQGGTGVSTSTGTGSVVLNTSPTLVTPALGTPASGVLTNATGLPLTTGVTGILPVANGGSGTATPGLVAGTNVSITGTWPNQTINSTASGSGSVTSVATGTGLTGGPITTTGTISLANTTVTPGTYTAANITIDAQGRITAAANGSGGGGGTVTSVSVVSANGFAGTVATASTTPAITLTTSITGLLKGNGTAISAATAGTDYLTPGGALGTPSSGTLTNATGLPLTTGVTGILPVANGGSGTATPALVAGTNVTITGTWPNQTINSTASGMVYPVAGIPNSTGSAWGTSYSTTGSGNVVLNSQPSLAFPKIDSIQASTSTGVTTILGFTNNAGTANGSYLNVANATPASNNPVVLSLANAGVYTPNLELQAAGNAGSYVAVNNGVTPSIKLQFNPTGTASTTTTLTSAQTANRTLNLPDANDTLVGKATSDVLTNKTISGATNSITGVSLTLGVTGTLPVNLGGTNQTSYTDGQLLIGNSTGNTLAKSTLTAGSGITITNGAGSITIASSVTAVTSVTGTSPIVSSGGTTPAISLATAYGDTLNPYASKTANYVLAAPNGTAGVPTFRAIVAADIPTLNQNTTGTAAGLSATLAIASGGTNTTATPTAGGVTYGTGTAQAYTAAGTTGQVLTSNGSAAPSWTTIGGIGTVTSVAATVPAFLSVSGSPITTSGTLAISYSGTALPVANGGTGTTTGSLVNCTVDGTNAVGYLNVPQNAQGVSYTLVASDAGKHIYNASGTGVTYTIPIASVVAYPIGTVISFVNWSSSPVTITLGSPDSMYLTGSGATGNRTLAQYGIATITKIQGLASTGIWFISGSGLT